MDTHKEVLSGCAGPINMELYTYINHAVAT